MGSNGTALGVRIAVQAVDPKSDALTGHTQTSKIKRLADKRKKSV